MNRHHKRASLLTGALVLAVTACGSAAGTKATQSSTVTPNTFVLREWSISPPTNSLNAGQSKLTASNQGRETHELVLIRARDAAALPTSPDGSVDESKVPAADKVGEITNIAAGQTTTKTFDLSSGDYLAICNIVDRMSAGTGGTDSSGMGGGMGHGATNGNGMSHIHYRLGMVTRFTVS